MEHILTTTNLAKSYGTTRALLGCSLHVPDGAVYALIGADGAGKSTLLRLVGGYEKPLTGTITLHGSLTRSRKEIQQHTGSVPALPFFRGRKTCRGFLSACHHPSEEEILKVLQMTDLQNEAAAPVCSLTADGQQRLAMAAALLTQPELLLLDEPFRNLPGKSRQDLQRLIRKLQISGISFVITASSVGEAGSLPTEYGFLCAGRLTGEYSAADVRTSAVIRVSSALRASEVLSGRLRVLKESDRSLRIFGEEDLTEVLLSLKGAGIQILPPDTAGRQIISPAVSGKGAGQWAAC